MSPEIQEWSHKSRSSTNILYLLTRPIPHVQLHFNNKLIVKSYAGSQKSCVLRKIVLAINADRRSTAVFFLIAVYRASLTSPGWHSDQYEVQLNQSCFTDVFCCQWRQGYRTEFVETAAAFAPDKQASK